MSTIIQQGRFTSDGTSKLISLRSDVDWMEIYNSTVADDDTQTTGVGVQFYWQRGMTAGSGIEYKKSNAANAAQLTTLLASGGFTLLDGSQSIGAAVTGTSITKASPPVCTATAHGYSNGDQVVLSNFTNMPQLGIMVWTIGNVTANTFELSFMDTNTANFTVETAFEVRKLPPFGWNNGYNYISGVTLGSTTAVTLSSNDPSATYEVGDILNFTVESDFGMRELNGLNGTILSYTAATNTYVVDIDSSSFTPFAWPASSAVPFNHPQVQLVGTSSTQVVGATRNEGAIEMKLDAGVDSPAGSSSDVIYWRAGKSFSISNE